MIFQSNVVAGLSPFDSEKKACICKADAYDIKNCKTIEIQSIGEAFDN